MQVVIALVLLVTCELCLTIRVPVTWDQSASEVKQEIKKDNDEQFSVESFKPQLVRPQNVDTLDEIPIPVDYFQYTAKKPQFAIDVAKFHGVQSPENHYKTYPIKPFTGKNKPELGKHHLLDKGNKIYRPLQEFANINEDDVSHAVPVSSNYEVFHPYEAETPALQEIYKDPILNKIRIDLENSKNRLQAYEKETGESDIHKDEYLESPEKTDNRFVPHRNVPAPYEIHRPQRRPIYYRPVPKHHQREQYLNQRLRHPWNQYSAKIRPVHYRPVKNHIHQLRQNHALKYDDERNEYPQVQILENYSSDPNDGYDIFERGKEKFVHLRNNNVDESINKAVKENRPAPYQKLEIQNNDDVNNNNDEDEFVPIKNYAQVRKTETFRHLPKAAALADAESFDEIRNAPRLREAVKSTKAQTVYSEEGYEDSAYDHAGEQKHASENEGHGGYLKEHELSGGKYKTPSESAKYEDGGGSAYRDQVVHAEKWKDDYKDNKKETDEEDYSDNEYEKSIDAQENHGIPYDESHRNKRENYPKNYTDADSSIQIDKTNDTSSQYDVNLKHNASFKVPEIDLNSTYLSEQEILELSKTKIEPKKDDIKQKYPYYFKNLKEVSKHSPLRYAENLKFIPRKSNGGTEFYDSRSKFECPEVDNVPDPIPDKLKRDGHPDENDDGDEEKSSNKGDENYDTAKKTPRLKGLGDKIDCFKAKYFGENPLDSPFFKEEIISNPEPVTHPNLASYRLKIPSDNEQIKVDSNVKSVLNTSVTQKIKSAPDIFDLIEKLRNEQPELKGLLVKSDKEIISPLTGTINVSNIDNHHLKQQFNVYSDVLDNIKNNLNGGIFLTKNNRNITETLTNGTKYFSGDGITYNFFQNKENITQSPPVIRKRRSTSFIYEPYKIIRDSQIQDSKKTTTTSNISPLIRQLQSSRVVDKVPKLNQDIEQSEKPVKRNVNSRIYKDIGRTDREPNGSKNDKGSADSTFVDISVDSRRGEPRYEIKRPNHKRRYTPVENRKSMTVEDYKQFKSKGETSIEIPSRRNTLTSNSNSSRDVQNAAASSNNVRKTISTTTQKLPKIEEPHQINDSESEEDYEEYDDDEEEEEENITTTTTTTQKPSFRRKMRSTTTTEKVPESNEKPKLKLVTRFRNYKPDESSETQEDGPDDREIRNPKLRKEAAQNRDEPIPKYREKKKKSTKSTLVTDTKRYGNDDDDDDMRKEEVDALIGVKQDMDDYMPLYEKEEIKKSHTKSQNRDTENDDEDEEQDDESEHSKKNESNNDDTDKEEDDDEIDDDHNDNENDTVDKNKDEDDDEDEEEDDEEEEESSELEPQVTTPEPTKRTLVITTDAPAPTFASRVIKPEMKPIITRKKIEIHKELPVNKSAPHITQFKQDIKEVEIIKEMPRVTKTKPQKNLEALELFKDDNLAKDVNKLGGVEIFKEDIDLKEGPKHGGNYRSAIEPRSAGLLKKARGKPAKEDAETSQSEFTKHIELDDEVPSNKMHGGNLRSLKDAYKTGSQGQRSKLIELSDTPGTSMHGGNLKHRSRGRNISKTQRIIEFDDEDSHNDDDPSSDHESFSDSGNSGPKHGGNYRSEQLVAEEKTRVTELPFRNKVKGVRRNSAAILNSFVQAAPILTSTPAYILDPSKRMYYYVDA